MPRRGKPGKKKQECCCRKDVMAICMGVIVIAMGAAVKIGVNIGDLLLLVGLILVVKGLLLKACRKF